MLHPWYPSKARWLIELPSMGQGYGNDSSADEGLASHNRNLPDDANRTDVWNRKNDWVRSEIHLNCNLEQQDLIEDSTTAYDLWRILRHEYNNPTDQKIKRLQKEFASVSMTEDDCTEYIRRVKRLVSDLKSCGARVQDADVAYSILTGLPERFSSLITTLTNMASPDKPLEVMRVCDQILEEERRLSHFTKKDPNVTNQ